MYKAWYIVMCLDMQKIWDSLTLSIDSLEDVVYEILTSIVDSDLPCLEDDEIDPLKDLLIEYELFLEMVGLHNGFRLALSLRIKQGQCDLDLDNEFAQIYNWKSPEEEEKAKRYIQAIENELEAYSKQDDLSIYYLYNTKYQYLARFVCGYLVFKIWADNSLEFTPQESELLKKMFAYSERIKYGEAS